MLEQMGDVEPQIPASARGVSDPWMSASGDYVSLCLDTAWIRGATSSALVVYSWTSSQWVQVHLQQCALEY